MAKTTVLEILKCTITSRQVPPYDARGQGEGLGEEGAGQSHLGHREEVYKCQGTI